MDIAARCFLERRTIVDRRERGEFGRAKKSSFERNEKGTGPAACPSSVRLNCGADARL